MKVVHFLNTQVNSAQERAIKLLESTLQLSNLDIVTSYVFKGGNSAPMPVTSTVQNDIIGPAASQAKVSIHSVKLGV